MSDNETEAKSRHQTAAHRAMARHPQTPVIRLRELADEADRHPDKRQRFAAALAANPNVPTDLVSRYLSLAPGDFCRNPALATMTLKEPLPNRPEMRLGLARLLRSAHAPRSLVSHIVQQAAIEPYLVASARLHVRLAGEIPPEVCEARLSSYWKNGLAEEINTIRGKLLRRLFDWNLAPPALRPILPPTVFAEMDNLPELTGRWNHLGLLEREWSGLQENIASGFLQTTSYERIVEITRRTLIKKALAEPEASLLAESSTTVLLCRTLAFLNAPEEWQRTRFRRFVESALWQDRLAAALVTVIPPGGAPKPRYRTLLQRLSEDGNGYVRAVARRRLLEPDWRFLHL